MKITTKLLVALFVFLIPVLGIYFGLRLGSGDSSSSLPKNDRPKVAASIFPVYSLTKELAGDDFQEELILPSGASEHGYEPTASDLVRLSGSKMVFVVGLELDHFAEKVATNLGAEAYEIYRGVELRRYEESNDHDHEHDEDVHDEDTLEAEHHEHGEHDPHYWLSFENATIMAGNIARALSEMNPESSGRIAERLSKLEEKYLSAHDLWKERVVSFRDRPFITFHDAFFYLAHTYDLTIAGSVEDFPGKNPTAADWRHLGELATNGQAVAIFTEPQLSPDGVEQFAKDYGLVVGELDPVGGLPGRESLFDLISYNLENLERILSVR